MTEIVVRMLIGIIFSQSPKVAFSANCTFRIKKFIFAIHFIDLRLDCKRVLLKMQNIYTKTWKVRKVLV